MALEKGIASLVEAFIAAGRPSSRDQHIDDRRAGYIASAVLAGETETRVRVEDITLEQGLFSHKADFFETIFSIRPVIRQKRQV